MDWKKNMKPVARWTAVSVAIFVLVLSILFVLAQTDGGKRQIARLLAQSLSRGDEIRAEVGEISGLIPFELELNRLALSDGKGPWLTIEGIALRWSPLAMLRGRFRINELVATHVQLTRLLPGGKDDEESPKWLPAWPRALAKLTVDRLAVERLVLGTAVLGEHATFAIEARFMAKFTGEERASSLRVKRTDSHKARAVITAKVRGEPRVVMVEAQVEEAPGGVFARALGCEGPLVFALHGEGPMEAWKGNVNAEIGGLGHLRSVLKVEARKDLRLVAKGTLGLSSELVSAAFVHSLGTESRFDVDVRLLRAETVVLDHLILEAGGGVNLHMAGSLDLKDQTTESEFTIRCVNLASMEAVVEPRIRGSVLLTGNLSGPLLQPQTMIAVKSEDMAVAGIEASAMDANLQVAFLGPVGSPVFGLRITGSGSVKNFAVQNSRLPANMGFGWTLKAEGSLEKTIQISELSFAGEDFTLGLSGLIHPGGQIGAMEAALQVRDLRWLSDFLGIEVPASVVLQGAIEGNAQTRSVSAQIRGKISILDQVSPSLKALLGNGVDYSGKVMLTKARKLTVSEFSLEAGTARLTGSTALDFEDNSLKGSWRLVMPELAVLSPVLNRSLAGQLQVDADMKGPLTMVRLNAEATGRDIVFEGWGVQGMSANLRMDGLPPKSLGHVQLELRQGQQHLKADADFDMEESSLTFSEVSMEAGENRLSGGITLDLKKYLVQGALEGHCKRLSDLSPFIKERVAGSAQLKTKFEIAKIGQKISFELQGENVKSRFGEASSLSVQGRLSEVFTNPQGKTELELIGYSFGSLAVSSLVLGAHGNLKNINYSGRMSGRYIEAFDMEVSGLWAMTSDGKSMKVNRLQASYGDWPVTLARPASIWLTPEGYAVEGLSLGVGEGRLEGSVRAEGDAVTLHTDFDALPLECLRFAGAPDLTGTASGSIRLQGYREESTGSIEMRLDKLALRAPQFQDLPLATLHGRGTLHKNRLKAAFSVQGLGEPVEAQLGIPVLMSVSPFTWSLPPQGELRGTLVGDIDLAWISPLISLHDQGLDGRLKVSMALGGTVDTPEVSGKGRIEKGSYENVNTGTVLKDVDLEMIARTPRLSIEDGHATDGEGGKISVHGWIDLLPNKDFPFNVDLATEHVKLVRLDHATATGSGQVRLSGSFARVLLTGQLEVNEADLRIPNRVTADIAELEVIEIPGASEEIQTLRDQGRSQKGDFRIEMTVLSPGKIYLRGRGLESEWQGNLKVTGKAAEPIVTGKLSVVRGHFNFLGKRFALVQGSLVMDGNVPPEPHIEVVGEASGKDVVAHLKLYGSALAPEITLSSVPELPQDEILSRLLFGRSVSDVSPVQAVKLAYAARQLTGSGGFDFMGKTRSLLGVDQLEIRQSGDNGAEPTVSAGKYLGEGVYLEVEKGAGPETGKTSVQVEITPNLSLETEIGENTQGGVGLNWKLNY
jgi:translocation and assembly module TamB